MKMMLMSALALAGCAQTARSNAPADATAPATGAKCDAAAVQDLIGKAATTVKADAQRRAKATTVRRYNTGDAVTMDYREDRLNIETDAAGMIVKLSCG